jgi:hypothetical protein
VNDAIDVPRLLLIVSVDEFVPAETWHELALAPLFPLPTVVPAIKMRNKARPP